MHLKGNAKKDKKSSPKYVSFIIIYMDRKQE